MPPQRNIRRFGKQQHQPPPPHQPLSKPLNVEAKQQQLLMLDAVNNTNDGHRVPTATTTALPNSKRRASFNQKSTCSLLSTTPHLVATAGQCDDKFVSSENVDKNFRCTSQFTTAQSGVENDEKEASDLSNNGLTTPSVCAVCRETIFDQYVVQIGTGDKSRAYHEQCLRCTMCKALLSGEQSCFVKDDVIYCRRDYIGLFATRCAKCHRGIATNDWVRRARDRVYHLACFACDVCKRQLSNGEEYTLIYTDSLINISGLNLSTPIHNNGGKRLPHNNNGERKTATNADSLQTTANDYKPLNSVSSSLSSDEDDDKNSFISTSSSNSPVDIVPCTNAPGFLSTNNDTKKISPVQYDLSVAQRFRAVVTQPQPLSTADETNDMSTSSSATALSSLPDAKLLCKAHYLELVEGPKANGSKPKSKRMRTTFTDEQIHILQTHFNVDSNPDGQDLERIALQTGLSKRVTQVWFQNSRARQKKSIQKRLHRQTGALGPPPHHHHIQGQPRQSPPFNTLLTSVGLLNSAAAASEVLRSSSPADNVVELTRSPSNCSISFKIAHDAQQTFGANNKYIGGGDADCTNGVQSARTIPNHVEYQQYLSSHDYSSMSAAVDMYNSTNMVASHQEQRQMFLQPPPCAPSSSLMYINTEILNCNNQTVMESLPFDSHHLAMHQ